MLYYYKTKKRRRFRIRVLLTISFMSVLIWAYFYPSSFANIMPYLESYPLPSLSSIKLKLLNENNARQERATVKQATDAITLDSANQAKEEMDRDGRKKESSELKYNLDLIAKIDKGDPESETRVRIIKRDIAKTISYFKAGNAASDKTQILGNYDGGHLAYVYYPNYGVHFNPVTTANLAISLYKKGDHKKVVKIADELLDNAVVKQYPGVGKYYIWEYYFDLEFADLKFPAPWASGMAQGLILDVFGKSYKITGDRKYLLAGDMVLNSFRVPWNENGVTDSDEHGNWYLEVAATDRLKILNGFLFALDGIHNYHEQTGNTKARRLFYAGINEVKAHLQEYDLGYWSNYSLIKGNRANYAYHKIHVDLLNKLYRITRVPELKIYAEKFDFYLKNRFIDIPPTHRSFKAISSLTERGIIISKDGWFSCSTEISRAELIGWLTRLRGWKPATTHKGHYADIGRDREDWGYIEAAFENGLKLADEKRSFRPDNSINRAEMASILCKAFVVSANKPRVSIIDVSSTDQYHDAIELALSNGLMDTYAPNYFRPNIKVTREQAANILYRLLDYQPR
ncbi:MAG: S-layer homology domain-containing protein [Actinobacteria bacterium]|nr:S-layer homology domain-containing protein [Actinomycetota bacterium]